MLRRLYAFSPLTPRYMTFPQTAKRLEIVKEGISVMDLI